MTSVRHIPLYWLQGSHRLFYCDRSRFGIRTEVLAVLLAVGLSAVCQKEVNLTETPVLVESIYQSWTPFKHQTSRCALLMTRHTVRSFVSASSCFPPSISLHRCPPGLSIHCLYHCMASFILLHFYSLPACLTKTTNASLLTLTVYLSFCSHTMIAGIQSIFSRGSQHTEP